MKIKDDYMSVSELAKEVGVVPQTVRNYVMYGRLVPELNISGRDIFHRGKLNLYRAILRGSRDSALVIRFTDSKSMELPSDDELQEFIIKRGYLFANDTAVTERDSFINDKLNEYAESEEFKKALAQELISKKSAEKEYLEKKIVDENEMFKNDMAANPDIISTTIILETIDSMRDISQLRERLDIDESVPNSEARKIIREKAEYVQKHTFEKASKALKYKVNDLRVKLSSLDAKYSEGASGYLEVRDSLIENQKKVVMEELPDGFRKARNYLITDVNVEDKAVISALVTQICNKSYALVVLVGAYEDYKFVFEGIERAHLVNFSYYNDEVIR